MAEKKKKKSKETDASALGRLSKAGEDALTRFVDELSRNDRVTEALGRAMSAKDKVDDGARRAMGSVGLAAAEELKDLRTHIERLEKRLAKLEAESKPKPKPKPRAKPADKPATTARATETTEASASPAPGRAIGGGSGRGSGAGGTAPS